MKRPWFLAGAWLWLVAALDGTQALADDFLSQEQAFPVSAEVIGPEAVRVVWDTADGYYLYKSKLRFDSETPGIRLGTAVLPEAEIKQDEFFGEVETYHGRLAVELPIVREPDSGNRLTLRVGSQGCADAGFCYPPHRETLTLALPEPAARLPVAAPATTGDKPRRLADLLTSVPPARGLSGTEDIPEVEQAFRVQAEVEAPDRVRLTWDIAPGTYLYADLIEIALVDSPDVALGTIERPAGTLKHDSVLPDGSIGDVEIHQGRLDLTVQLQRVTTAPITATLIVKYQGCAEIGICYPPQSRRITLNLPEAPATLADAATMTTSQSVAEDAAIVQAAPVNDPGGSGPPVSEQDRIAAVLAGEGLWVIIAVFFGFGLLLAFTPCVFPMIPILSGIIAGQGAGLTTRKAFVLSLVYVLAMALTYTLVGVLAGLLGANLQAAFQNPWILTAFALVFVGLALSMFGFYELQLPSSLQSKLAELSNRQQGGTLIGVAIMGLLSALIVGPCVAPPLFGALIYIGHTGDALLGGLALFALSLGMGVPLILIGTSVGRYLPRAGAWMNTVKAVFGVALLGVAILMLERLLPPALAMVLWALLLICSAVYMGALNQLQPGANAWFKLWKGLGLVLLIYGALMLIGAAAGGRDTLQPLRGLIPGGGVEQLGFKRIKSVADLERELAQARSDGQPVLLDFYADWCVSCQEMERYTFSDPSVMAELRRFVRLQADVTANDAEDRALIQGRFGLPGPPAILFFDRAGRELTHFRLVGFKPAEPFARHLRQVAP